MKKVFMTWMLLAVVGSVMAQTQFHDKEVNEVKGPVKSVTMKNWGKPIVTYISPFIWENGHVKTQIATRKNKKVITNNVYDDNGILVRQIIETDGHEVTYDYYDIQLDDHGNWTSRKTKVAGIEVIYPRTIQYY